MQQEARFVAHPLCDSFGAEIVGIDLSQPLNETLFAAVYKALRHRCVLHRATSFDTTHERRVLRRATVLGDLAEARSWTQSHWG